MSVCLLGWTLLTLQDSEEKDLIDFQAFVSGGRGNVPMQTDWCKQ